jgi:hypothetical protein
LLKAEGLYGWLQKTIKKKAIHTTRAMDQLCLDLNKYTLDEILTLLDLPQISDVTASNMKQARKKVLMTHPDKSKLDGSIFRFYVAAYDAVEQVVSFRDRSNTSQCAYLAKHNNIDKEVESSVCENELIEAGYLTREGRIGKNWNKFNRKFNEWFERNSQLLGEDEGHSDFLKSDEDLLPENATKEQAKMFMENRRKQLMAVCKYEDVQGIDSYSSSSRFGSGYGEDIRQAYTETVVPVDESDYQNRRKYGSIGELQRSRRADMEGIDYEVGKTRHSEKKAEEDKDDINRFFNQISLFEKNKEAVKQFQKDLFRIKN